LIVSFRRLVASSASRSVSSKRSVAEPTKRIVRRDCMKEKRRDITSSKLESEPSWQRLAAAETTLHHVAEHTTIMKTHHDVRKERDLRPDQDPDRTREVDRLPAAATRMHPRLQLLLPLNNHRSTHHRAARLAGNSRSACRNHHPVHPLAAAESTLGLDQGHVHLHLHLSPDQDRDRDRRHVLAAAATQSIVAVRE
jgi:hypothetical protein